MVPLVRPPRFAGRVCAASTPRGAVARPRPTAGLSRSIVRILEDCHRPAGVAQPGRWPHGAGDGLAGGRAWLQRCGRARGLSLRLAGDAGPDAGDRAAPAGCRRRHPAGLGRAAAGARLLHQRDGLATERRDGDLDQQRAARHRLRPARLPDQPGGGPLAQGAGAAGAAGHRLPRAQGRVQRRGRDAAHDRLRPRAEPGPSAAAQRSQDPLGAGVGGQDPRQVDDDGDTSAPAMPAAPQCTSRTSPSRATSTRAPSAKTRPPSA